MSHARNYEKMKNHIEKVHYRGTLGCTLPHVWLVPTGVYLIYVLIGNLSYTPWSEPSRTLLFLDVMNTTDPHQRRKSNSPRWGRSILIPPCSGQTQ